MPNEAQFTRAIYDAELAPNTRAAYRKGVESFTAYCAAERSAKPLCADEHVVSAWLLWLSDRIGPKGAPLSVSTIKLYRAGLNKWFEVSGQPSPCNHPLVKATMRGLARERSSKPRLAAPLREHHVAAMADACPSTVIGARDASIITLGFAAALRRSEIVALRVQDITFSTDSEESRMMVRIAKSKTDQSGLGYEVAVPDGILVRPVSRLRAWLDASGLEEGILYRAMGRQGEIKCAALDGGRVSLILKRLAGEIGLDPRAVSAHSMRAGFITSAGVHRARMDKIMEVSRHRTPGMVLHYTRDIDAFESHAGREFL